MAFTHPNCLILGVVSKELVLSDEPPLGSWTIAVKTNNDNEETKSFKVEKYGKRWGTFFNIVGLLCILCR